MPSRSGRSPRWLSPVKIALFLVCLLPLVRLVMLGMRGGLGANPIEFITHSTGTWALIGLLLTLSITPLRRLTGWTFLLRHRRMLGLFAFFYASLHLVTYLWLDQFFDLERIVRDVVKRPFVTAGFAGFVLLVPLALTSTQTMMRRLGRHWQQLHRLIYVAAGLGVLHYAWLVKRDLTQPLIYGGLLGVLLFFRLQPGVNVLETLRRRRGQAGV
ncbi:MAG: sulfoxide reductase heme-binding subunit YedZ [Thiobacillus sp. 65-69]|nr:sulfoxide reductase heme-binding subunit YedZ [Thiobacillus sp.]ODU90612.1 MAG: sulfoxide reductase heme-binding subunit YedZ [Thiobacillus sp. SCN 65-179]OJW35961.1 MAG: sulfoxide reductase heme-binding subunit YedZ [Thiobacillus sp. 65-69]